MRRKPTDVLYTWDAAQRPYGTGKPCGFFGGTCRATSLHHMLFGKAWRLFRGDVQEQRPSITCYSGKPNGFFRRTCRSNVPPSHAIRESLTAFSGDVREQRHSITCYSGKPGGFFRGTCRSNVPPSEPVLQRFFPFYPHGSCIYEIIFVPLQRVCLRSRPVFCHSAAYLERLGCRTDLRCRQAHPEKRIPRNRNKTDD